MASRAAPATTTTPQATHSHASCQQLAALRVLTMGKNKLSNISQYLPRLCNLRHFELQNNKVRSTTNESKAPTHKRFLTPFAGGFCWCISQTATELATHLWAVYVTRGTVASLTPTLSASSQPSFTHTGSVPGRQQVRTKARGATSVTRYLISLLPLLRPPDYTTCPRWLPSCLH